MVFKLIILNIFFSSLVISAPVDLDNARKVAANIYKERSNTGLLDGFNIRSIDIIEENDANLIYIFQIDSDGFIMVSGEDRIQPLLAYSFESNLVLDDMPSNLSWMIDAYKGMINNAIVSNESSTEKINAEWRKYYSGDDLNIRDRDMKGPLFTSHWNQSSGWNDYGPPADQSCEGDQAPSGCVAVSMASIMHYWQYPITGQGDNSCYCGGYGTQYANFGDAVYDYAAMGTAETASDAAAFLVWHAGVAVNMDYDCPGSGAQVSGGYPSALYAMENNFLYKDNIYTSYRSSSSDSQWINYLVTEIDNNRPMIYVGYNDEGGHAWNCDGYDDELFHMNWGWGGQSDGWFTVTENGDPDGWGDGSHILRNIEPESLNRPNLRLESYTSYESSGDGDMVINPGETFEMVVDIENPAPWSAASSIELLLTSDEDGINIDGGTSSIISFETIEAGGTFTNASMPFIIDVDNDIALGDKTFNLLVMGVGIEGAEDNFFYRDYEIEILISINQYGFPVFEASQKTSPLEIDMDGDGNNEIIFGDYNGSVHIVNSDGSNFDNDNFPFDTGNQIWGAPAGADVDGDGLNDIAIVSKSKHFYLLDKNGVKLDIDTEKFLLGTPAIGNLDDDSDLEIVFSGYSSNNLLWAINPDGSAVEGFPVELGEKVKIGVALADFNGNGKDDIIVGTDSDYLHLIYDDGSEAPGFPFEVGNNIQSAPSVLDVDDQKVIFFGCNDNNFYAVNSDGSLRFSITADNKIYNSPAFLDHNNTFYIFFSDDGGILHAVDTEGNLLSGWPVNSGETISKSVIFSDLDNNGSAEVIVATESANILVYNLDGTMYDGFPVLADQSFFSAPMVSDMDGDGDLEIIAASGGSLQVLDIKLDGATDGYWSMFRGNTERTGYFEFTGGGSECGASLGDVSGDGTINILDLVQIANYILNIGDPAFECAADFTEDGTVNILDLVQIANFILDN